MARPGEEMAPGAGGRGRLRAAHADREQAIEVLKAAFVRGRLTKDEFDARVGQVLASRTYADLTRVTADLPAGVATVQHAPARAQARKPVDKIRVAAWSASAGVVLTALATVSAVAANSHGLFYVFMLAFIVTAGLAYAFVAEAWTRERSHRHLPQGPAPDAGGQVSRRTGSAARQRHPRGRGYAIGCAG